MKIKFTKQMRICNFIGRKFSMMTKKQNSKIYIGSEFYDKLLLNSTTFVDKSVLIKEFLSIEQDVVLLTFPRRFGESINMDMLNKFFSVEVDKKEKHWKKIKNYIIIFSLVNQQVKIAQT